MRVCFLLSSVSLLILPPLPSLPPSLLFLFTLHSYNSVYPTWNPRKATASGARKILLDWAQPAGKAQGLVLDNLDQDWRDGLGFAALVSHYDPESLDYASVKVLTPLCVGSAG